MPASQQSLVLDPVTLRRSQVIAVAVIVPRASSSLAVVVVSLWLPLTGCFLAGNLFSLPSEEASRPLALPQSPLDSP
ncbi:hypothetical protein CC78DRAFT_576038 [Lojkania enalia]|uniref:Uncharacterized protein n=1 Tax=Lojkania enalia TaxID=147567 RepID=A0A9P4KHX3_9PLEO|nr:hypothetical protein CC78DRAFT_576038 [Didymosphaeria enalia]